MRTNFSQLAAFLLLGISHSLAAPPSERVYKTKEQISTPQGWIKHTEAPADHRISLRIGLPQENYDLLEKHLYEVSDPTHKRYGQHLSKEEVEALVAPHPNSLSAINTWLAEFGLTEEDLVRSSAKDWVVLNIPVSLAEKMLNTKYYVWKHAMSGDELVRTTSYSLPSNLHEHVDVVQPTTMFGRLKQAKSSISIMEEIADPDTLGLSKVFQISPVNSAVTVDPRCKTTVTISCLQQLYNSVGYVPSDTSKNSIGITGYLDQFANLEDLQSFFADQVPAALNSSFKFESVNGGLNDQNISLAGTEANLDVQFAFGLSHPIPGIYYSTAGRPPYNPDAHRPTNENEPFADWLDYILEKEDPPYTISTSYGDDEQTVPEEYARRVCAGFTQLGARGVSVLFASGDTGVGDGDLDPETQKCFTNDGTNSTRFIPVFPASCPHVTSVGGTTNIPEVAVSRFYSGGGFSDYFKRPAYQDLAVPKYLETLPKGTYEGLYNPNGRGIPDVSAQADYYRFFYKGRAYLIGGTSAAAPTFASFVALLNDARIKAKMGPLGFLNPLLYTAGLPGLNDIIFGNNPGCGTPGFNVSVGWDPVTGLGTPNFNTLKQIVTSPFVF